MKLIWNLHKAKFLKYSREHRDLLKIGQVNDTLYEKIQAHRQHLIRLEKMYFPDLSNPYNGSPSLSIYIKDLIPLMKIQRNQQGFYLSKLITSMSGEPMFTQQSSKYYQYLGSLKNYIERTYSKEKAKKLLSSYQNKHKR